MCEAGYWFAMAVPDPVPLHPQNLFGHWFLSCTLPLSSFGIVSVYMSVLCHTCSTVIFLLFSMEMKRGSPVLILINLEHDKKTKSTWKVVLQYATTKEKWNSVKGLNSSIANFKMIIEPISVKFCRSSTASLAGKKKLHQPPALFPEGPSPFTGFL